MKVYRESRIIDVKHGKWTSTGWQETGPTEHIPIDLEIDIDALFADVGTKAARSKGGRSVEAGGAIIAKRRRV